MSRTVSPPPGKRDSILQAALEILAERGFHNAPMSLISKRAQASPGIVYHYFESKDELIQEIYQQVYGNSLRAFHIADDPQEPLPKRFQMLWLSVYSYCVSHPIELAFLDQYEHSPTAQQTKNAFQVDTRSLDGLLASLTQESALTSLTVEERALVGLMAGLRAHGLIKDLPPAVIAEFAVGVPRRLARQAAAGELTLSEEDLLNAAQACWNAMAA